MRLGELLPDCPPEAAAIAVAGVTADSRKVVPGKVFVAVKGEKADGAAFAADAAARGAVAVVAAPDAVVDATVPVVRDEDPRRRLALMAAALAGPQPEAIVAVTGTAGKTSVAEFTRQIFTATGGQAVSIGTLGIRGAVEVPGGLTTPDPVDLHERLAALALDGVTHVAMEASSHGLSQRRLDGVRLAAAGFTNIGRDHLDYHGSEEAYLAAKLRLFDTLQPVGARTVVNPDAPGAASVLAIAPDAFTVGSRGEGLHLESAERVPEGARLLIDGAAGPHDVLLPLVGDFQVENALIAAGLAIVAGVPETDAVPALEALGGAPGRLELVGRARKAPVFVDYAHKPEAVTAALSAVRPGIAGRLVVVLGAGGDRDPGKRPLMGRAATAIADVVIVTDDNPRSEDPAAIRRAILAAAPGALEIPDRGEAIRHAVQMLREGDALVIAGKGHETGQVVGDRTLPFSDHAAVKEAIGSL
jgi:UDP-N-acetylmuramoyl-L-alanyl-D-glutamate--2,6-diaminopimelate ligase